VTNSTNSKRTHREGSYREGLELAAVFAGVSGKRDDNRSKVPPPDPMNRMAVINPTANGSVFSSLPPNPSVHKNANIKGVPVDLALNRTSRRWVSPIHLANVPPRVNPRNAPLAQDVDINGMLIPQPVYDSPRPQGQVEMLMSAQNFTQSNDPKSVAPSSADPLRRLAGSAPVPMAPSSQISLQRFAKPEPPKYAIAPKITQYLPRETKYSQLPPAGIQKYPYPPGNNDVMNPRSLYEIPNPLLRPTEIIENRPRQQNIQLGAIRPGTPREAAGGQNFGTAVAQSNPPGSANGNIGASEMSTQNHSLASPGPSAPQVLPSPSYPTDPRRVNATDPKMLADWQKRFYQSSLQEGINQYARGSAPSLRQLD
jgi:hypothetical protein